MTFTVTSYYKGDGYLTVPSEALNQISRKPYHIGLRTFIRNRSFQPNNKVLHVSKIKLLVDYFMNYIQIKKPTHLIQKMNYSTYVVLHNLTYQNI